MKRFSSRQLALNGLVAGLYAVVTILTASFAYGNIQFRIADALCLLVILEPSLTVGLTLGCLIANLFSTVSALDIVIGTAGTLLGCLLLRRDTLPALAPIPVALSNAALVGAMLAWLYLPENLLKGFLIFGGEVLLVASVLLVLWNTTSITFAELAGCILIPFLLANDGYLLLLKKIKSEKLCQSFLGFGIVLIAIIVISFRSTEQMLWMRMTPATVVSILGLVLYGVYQSMTLFKKYE